MSVFQAKLTKERTSSGAWRGGDLPRAPKVILLRRERSASHDTGTCSWSWTLGVSIVIDSPLRVGRGVLGSVFEKRVLCSEATMRLLWRSVSSKLTLCFFSSNVDPSLMLSHEISSSLLLRGQSLLQELLDLVDIRLHLPVEGQEGRVGARG